jgi:hypothetical protein
MEVEVADVGDCLELGYRLQCRGKLLPNARLFIRVLTLLGLLFEVVGQGYGRGIGAFGLLP